MHETLRVYYRVMSFRKKTLKDILWLVKEMLVIASMCDSYCGRAVSIPVCGVSW